MSDAVKVTELADGRVVVTSSKSYGVGTASVNSEGDFVLELLPLERRTEEDEVTDRARLFADAITVEAQRAS